MSRRHNEREQGRIPITGYVHYKSGASLDISELKSPSWPPDCTAEDHDWGHEEHRRCHSNGCEHSRCRICDLEKIAYDIQLRDRPGLDDDLQNAGILPGMSIIDWTYEVPSVEVTRYVQHATPAAPMPH